jgi:hypothetical protein
MSRPGPDKRGLSVTGLKDMRAVKLTRGYGSNSETYFPLGETTTSALSFTPACAR